APASVDATREMTSIPPDHRASGTRRDLIVLLLIAAAGLVVRLAYILIVKRNEPISHLGDQLWYNAQANWLADGHGFYDVAKHSPTAEHPPLVPLMLAPFSWVAHR